MNLFKAVGRAGDNILVVADIERVQRGQYTAPFAKVRARSEERVQSCGQCRGVEV